MKKTSIWFIINPKAGGGKARSVQTLAESLIDKNHYQISYQLTEYVGHGSLLAEDAVKQKIDMVVAVGGDGTINEIAKELIDSKTVLGIIPMGSGNGLARDLGISMNPKKAILQIIEGSKKQIDACFINQIPFFCSAGFGFDAHCAKKFNAGSSRGLINYIKVSLLEYFTFKPIICQMAGVEYAIFSMTFGNARQFGNNAYICPNAEIDDGFFDITLIKKHPFFMGSIFAWHLFAKTIDTAPYTEHYRASHIEIGAKENLLIHFDGEPKQLNTNKIEVCIKNKCLTIIC